MILQIQEDAISEQAEKLKMNASDYLKGLEDHLNSENTEFKFAKNEFILQYMVSKIIKVKYLQCKLAKVRKFKLYAKISN